MAIKSDWELESVLIVIISYFNQNFTIQIPGIQINRRDKIDSMVTRLYRKSQFISKDIENQSKVIEFDQLFGYKLMNWTEINDAIWTAWNLNRRRCDL